MAKPELGTKRVCPVTGRKFYDLNKNPVISPYTGEVVPIAPVAASRSRPDTKVTETAEPEVETAEAGAEFVSLEDADAEAQGKKAELPDAVDDDIEVEDDPGDDDSTFIEEDEEGDDDVTDIIGDGIEKDEET
ncbi:MAG: TIGR02300 family protein [Pseudorhodoplanes sp.]|uniref:TIGR02300 family protein n=1 Tax=Pseudorhodoplanes sp. TaxID=1934341 RepID=UPI003D0BD36C